MRSGLRTLLDELLEAPMAAVPAGEAAVAGLSCLSDSTGRVNKWTLRFPEGLVLKELCAATGWQWLPAVDYIAPPSLGQDVRCLEAVSRGARPFGVLVAAVRHLQVLEISRFPGPLAPAERR